MRTYSTATSSKYSFSNANMVYNEDGIQVHREESPYPKQAAKVNEASKIQELSR